MGAPSAKTWRFLDAYPNYMVSDQGDVRHVRKNSPFLVGDKDRKGYRRVLIDGKHRRVNRLVCEAFHGPCPDAHECAHLDGNLSNNSADNLAWVTRSENTHHSIEHGTYSRARTSKLTEQQVSELRAKAAAGQSERSLAAEYGISPSQTHRVIARERWAHV